MCISTYANIHLCVSMFARVIDALLEDPVQDAAQVHIPGMGIADGSGTLARLLLSRINISIYGPEAREPARKTWACVRVQNGVDLFS